MSDESVYTIINNPLLQSSSAISSAIDGIHAKLQSIGSYTPVEVDTFSDWSYRAGDVVSVTKDGEAYSMPIFRSSLRWDGASSLQWASSGSEKREVPTVEKRESYRSACTEQHLETLDGEYRIFVEHTDTAIGFVIVTDDEDHMHFNVSQMILDINTQTGETTAHIHADYIDITDNNGNSIQMNEVISLTGGNVQIEGDLSIWDDVATRVLTVGGAESAGAPEGTPADVTFIDGQFTCSSRTFFQSDLYCIMTNDDDTVTEIDIPAHYHTIQFTELTDATTGDPTGEIQMTLGHMTNTASEAIDHFNMADTAWYADQVLAYKGAVSSALGNAGWNDSTFSTRIYGSLNTSTGYFVINSANAYITYPDDSTPTEVPISLSSLDVGDALDGLWSRAYGSVTLDYETAESGASADDSYTMSSGESIIVYAQAKATRGASTVSNARSILIVAPSSGGGGGGGSDGDDNVIYNVPIGAEIKCAHYPNSQYTWKWMPVWYPAGTDSPKGFMMSQFVVGTLGYQIYTGAVSGSLDDLDEGSKYGRTSVDQLSSFNQDTTVYAKTGSTVRLRSSPSAT